MEQSPKNKIDRSESNSQRIYSIVDIETTGGQRHGNKITEIAIINFDGSNIIEEFSTLINPERSIPWQITKLTGIDNDMVARAPKFYEVAKKIVEMIEGNIFVAHNVFFDFNFIKMEFADLGYTFNPEKLCTVRLARKNIPGHSSYSLGKICRDLGITIADRHRAMGDARATLELFQHIQNNSEDQIIPFEKKALPPHLSEKVYRDLPHETGVYYFYDRNEALLYIGKSKNIKSRIDSHFRPDMKRTKDIELKNNIADIKYTVLKNELAALLYENQEIKKFFPPYNHALKRRKFPYAVELVEDQDGLFDFKVCHRDEFSNYYYSFKSRHVALKKINSFYRAIIGHPKDSIHFIPSKESTIKSLGKEKYNELVNKVFHERIPNFQDFNLHFEKDNCIIEVRDFEPKKIIYYDREGEITENIILKKDPDMIDILRNYMYKYGLKGSPIV